MSKTKLQLVHYGSVPAFTRKKRPRTTGRLKTCSRYPLQVLLTPKLMLPDGIEVLDTQVAGHMFQQGNSIGMLKQNGRVLKPTTKSMCAEREIRFYEELQTSSDPVLMAMRKFVPGYYGVNRLPVNGNLVECIVLDDVTSGMKEPCVMDVKIGKRTWDPLATEEKMKNENSKYVSKRDVGFCIPGFQVKNISDGKLYKYDKDYGKKLNGDGITQALRIFLNADSGFCRPLLVQLVGFLWRILHWCRNQRKLRVYSSSILLVYDARALRSHIKNNRHIKSTSPTAEQLSRYKLHRPLSLSINHSSDEDIKVSSPGFSGQLTPDGPKFERSLSTNNADITPMNVNSEWKKTFKKLQRIHSSCNNYEEELKNLKKNYAYILDDLVTDSADIWANVKMIDLAHVFPSEGNTLDLNYLEGIENLVKILENFLEECK